MRKSTFLSATMLLLVACDNRHPARPVVEQFAAAVVAGDVEQIFATHVDSTPQGAFCRKEFRDILEKARTLDEAGCATTIALHEEVSGLNDLAPDEVQLALQTGRWVCENPRGTCVDYARTVFEQSLQHSEFADPVTVVSVEEVVGDASNAVAQLTLDTSKPHTLYLQNVGEGWRITRGVLPR